MNAYNPLSAMKRLEGAGLPRQHAEAIASEIEGSTSDLVTQTHFDAALQAALDKQTIKMAIITAAMLTLACTIIGTVTAVLAINLS